MNRKLSFIVVIALVAFLALLLSASGVIARGTPQEKTITQPPAPVCAASTQAARVNIFGQVFDEQGTPQAGLRVQATGPDGQGRGEALTQADGRYRLPELPAGHYTLQVREQHGRPLPLRGEVDVVAAASNPWIKRDVMLASAQNNFGPQRVQATGQITGMVTASNTGLPLADVDVTAYDAATGNYIGGSYTDSTGKYVIDFLDTGFYKIDFSPYGSAANYIEQFYNNQPDFDTATPVHVVDTQTTPNINAALQLGGQITGRVTAADTHTPLEDVSVEVSSSCPSWWEYTQTDANGVYTVTGIPTGNDYRVSFDPSNSSLTTVREYIKQYYNNQPDWSSATPIAVTAPNVVNNINAALLHGGAIKGTVTGAGSGGLADVAVTIEGQGHSTYLYITTDASGAYTLTGLLSDTYKIEFSPAPYGVAKDYAYQYYNSKPTWTTANTVTVIAPNVTPNINQVLPLGSHITGKITTADTALPVYNGNVNVYASDGNSVAYAYTNASGVYTTSAVPTGSYRIRFEPSSSLEVTYTTQYYNNKLTWATADLLNVTAPNLVSNINAALTHGGQISGTITAANTGSPLQGVYVDIYDSTGAYVGYVSSNANGAYLTPALLAGNYRVYFGGTTACSGACYTGQYYNNKPTLATANVIAVVVDQVTKNINAALAVCAAGPTPPNSVSIGSAPTGTTYSFISFSALVSPVNASTPITYTWQTAGQSPIRHTGAGISDTVGLIWYVTGTKTITVTAANAYGSATNTRTVIVEPSNIVFDNWVYLPIVTRQ